MKLTILLRCVCQMVNESLTNLFKIKTMPSGERRDLVPISSVHHLAIWRRSLQLPLTATPARLVRMPSCAVPRRHPSNTGMGLWRAMPLSHMLLCFLVQMLTCMNFSDEVRAANVRQNDVSLLEIEAEVEDLRGQIAEQEKIVNLLKGHDCPPDSPICLQKRAGFAQRMYRRQVSKTFKFFPQV
jgi:hypothetical protein